MPFQSWLACARFNWQNNSTFLWGHQNGHPAWVLQVRVTASKLVLLNAKTCFHMQRHHCTRLQMFAYICAYSLEKCAYKIHCFKLTFILKYLARNMSLRKLYRGLACRCWDHDETLEMDRPHSPKALYQHHKTSPVLESLGKLRGTGDGLGTRGNGTWKQTARDWGWSGVN